MSQNKAERIENGGVLVTPPLNLVSHLDWLELTYPNFGQKTVVAYPDNWDTKRVACKPANGYKMAFRYADGRTEMSHPEQAGMGVHITIPAKTLSMLAEDDLWLLGFFLEQGAKVTRLDCALDVYDKPLDFDALWMLAKAKEYECRLRQPPLRTSDAALGDTIYFGRMKSSIFTRIYNKAVEQKVEKIWTRIETVTRHSRANNAAKLMVKRNLDSRQIIAGHLNLPRLEWWTDVMTMKAEKTRLDPVSVSKRVDWLYRSVAPTLAKEIHLAGWGIYDEFRKRVIDELQKLDNT